LRESEKWIKPRKRTYILPGYALARRFRERVEIAFRKTGLYDLMPRRAWRQPWVANVKRVGAGETALLYLSRYVFRVAISNQRILAFDGHRVTFSARNRDGTTALHSLDALELIRRFLQHVLPSGFVKVRYYGLWAPTNHEKLAVARGILEHHLGAIGKPPRPRPVDGQNLTAGRRPAARTAAHPTVTLRARSPDRGRRRDPLPATPAQPLRPACTRDCAVGELRPDPETRRVRRLSGQYVSPESSPLGAGFRFLDGVSGPPPAIRTPSPSLQTPAIPLIPQAS